MIRVINFYNDVDDATSLNTLLSLDLDPTVPTLLLGDFNLHSRSGPPPHGNDPLIPPALNSGPPLKPSRFRLHLEISLAGGQATNVLVPWTLPGITGQWS
jgi:hypothetical protein